jgi:nicotinate-nucleotide adenylyltransferase
MQLDLDGVRFVPASTQPLKVGRASASPADRLAMTERLVQGIPGFSVDPAEIGRPGLSYTVDTLAGLAAAIPERSCFCSSVPMPTRSSISGGSRAGSCAGDDRGAGAGRWRSGPTTPGVQVLQSRRVDISSTELRARVRDGRTIRGFVPDAVADYIAEHRLYR